MLARYSDPHGRLREILTRPGSGGSLLLIDLDVATRRDRRLLAHLAADEPPANAALVCEDYLGNSRKRPCRPLIPEDLWVAPFAAEASDVEAAGGIEVDGRASDWAPEVDGREADLLDARGNSYRLRAHAEGIALPELRWHRIPPAAAKAAEAVEPKESEAFEPEPISLRQAVASLQRYQPLRDITARALLIDYQRQRLSISTLRAELQRVDTSPIVLNRGLREAIQRALAGGDSLSEIATRCGRLKCEAGGTIHGDTSWLARRAGLLPNAGKREPTPWVHSDVLALIARRGLRISPREVEL